MSFSCRMTDTAWLILYEDIGEAPEVFSGDHAQATAYERFLKRRAERKCILFKSISPLTYMLPELSVNLDSLS